MLRPVIGIVVVATFVGALMPGRSPGSDKAESSQSSARPWFEDEGGSTSKSGDSQGWGSSRANTATSGGEVRLTRRGDGHFYADVEVNGTNVEFLIDTGASSIAMTEADARRAGVRLDSSGRTYVGEGAGGALTGQIVKLDRVRLGDQSTTSMQAVVIDGASTNLLGQSFLSQFSEVNVRGDVMTLR